MILLSVNMSSFAKYGTKFNTYAYYISSTLNTITTILDEISKQDMKTELKCCKCMHVLTWPQSVYLY